MFKAKTVQTWVVCEPYLRWQYYIEYRLPGMRWWKRLGCVDSHDVVRITDPRDAARLARHLYENPEKFKNRVARHEKCCAAFDRRAEEYRAAAKARFG